MKNISKIKRAIKIVQIVQHLLALKMARKAHSLYNSRKMGLEQDHRELINQDSHMVEKHRDGMASNLVVCSLPNRPLFIDQFNS